MASFNQITLVGRLGKDPEFQFTPNGTPVCKCSLAVDDFTSGGGKQTQWFNLIFWQKLAETVEKYLSSGSCILVTGKITSRKWKAKDDSTHETWEVTVNQMQMLDSKKETQQKTVRTSKDESNDFDPFLEDETDFDRLLVNQK